MYVLKEKLTELNRTENSASGSVLLFVDEKTALRNRLETATKT